MCDIMSIHMAMWAGFRSATTAFRVTKGNGHFSRDLLAWNAQGEAPGAMFKAIIIATSTWSRRVTPEGHILTHHNILPAHSMSISGFTANACWTPSSRRGVVVQCRTEGVVNTRTPGCHCSSFLSHSPKSHPGYVSCCTRVVLRNALPPHSEPSLHLGMEVNLVPHLLPSKHILPSNLRVPPR